MAFLELYADAASGNNMYGGSDAGSSPTYSATNGGWNSGTGVFTPVSGNPSAVSPTLVGQVAHVFTDGSTTPKFIARVTAVSSTTVTVSLSAKSGTAPTTAGSGISINVGGAFKGPNGAVMFPFDFLTSTLTDASSNPPRVNFKGGTNYAITAGMTHFNSGPMHFAGYTSTVGDGGYATFDGGTSGASYVLLHIGAQNNFFCNLKFQNNGATGSSQGMTINARVQLEKCVVSNVRGDGYQINAGTPIFYECEAYSWNGSASSYSGFAFNATAQAVRCIAHDTTTTGAVGFYVTADAILSGCIASNVKSHGFSLPSTAQVYVGNCNAKSCQGSGIYISNAYATIENCILTSNSVYGIESPAASNGQGVRVSNCAFYSNTSGQTNNLNSSRVSGTITLTGDPYTNAASGDFTLDNTASEGAACRGAGRGTFTQTAAGFSGTLGYPDVGASQHQDAGGSSGGIIGGGMSGGMKG